MPVPPKARVAKPSLPDEPAKPPRTRPVTWAIPLGHVFAADAPEGIGEVTDAIDVVRGEPVDTEQCGESSSHQAPPNSAESQTRAANKNTIARTEIQDGSGR